MIHFLSGMLRKLLAVGLVLAVPLALWLAAVEPLWNTYRGNWERLRELAAVYVRYRDVADQAEAVKAAAADKALNQHDETFKGASAAIVQASLQTVTQELVSGSGASFLSAQAAPPKDADSVSYQGLQLTLNGEIGTIAETIRSIEASRPYLFIDRAELRRQGFTPEDEAYAPVVLEVTLDIYAATAVPSDPGELSP